VSGPTFQDLFLLARTAPTISRPGTAAQIVRLLAAGPLSEIACVQALTIARAVADRDGPALALPPPLREQFRKQLTAAARDVPKPHRALAWVAAGLVAADLCAGGTASALDRLAADVVAGALDLPIAFAGPGLAAILETTGVIRAPGAALPSALAAIAAPGGRLADLLILAGLSAVATPERREEAFTTLVLPLLERLATEGYVDTILTLERTLYANFVKQREVPEHHRVVFGHLDRLLGPIGTTMAARLPALPVTPVPSRPRVAFYLMGGALLAHAEVMVTFLRGLLARPDPMIEPVMALTGDLGQIGAAATELGIEIVRLSGDPDTVAYAVAARERLQAHRIDALVFVSIPLHLALYRTFRLAPVQIWWSMKFQLPNFDGIDGRLCYRSMGEHRIMVDGALWYTAPVAIDRPRMPTRAEIDAVRAPFAGRLILGVVARGEKIAEPDYLEGVVRILRARPDAVFLWTGRSRAPAVQRAFEAAGVADRCHFVGWVDAALFCAAFDIFLETFPLTGIMSAWAMYAGVPVASAGPLCWFATHLDMAFDGTEPTGGMGEQAMHLFEPLGRKPWAADVDGFVALTLRLAEDAPFRAAFVEAGRRFMTEYLADGPASAEAVAAQMVAILRDTAARRVS
jgi:hypothetical protein